MWIICSIADTFFSELVTHDGSVCCFAEPYFTRVSFAWEHPRIVLYRFGIFRDRCLQNAWWGILFANAWRRSIARESFLNFISFWNFLCVDAISASTRYWVTDTAEDFLLLWELLSFVAWRVWYRSFWSKHRTISFQFPATVIVERPRKFTFFRVAHQIVAVLQNAFVVSTNLIS